MGGLGLTLWLPVCLAITYNSYKIKIYLLVKQTSDQYISLLLLVGSLGTQVLSGKIQRQAKKDIL